MSGFPDDIISELGAELQTFPFKDDFNAALEMMKTERENKKPEKEDNQDENREETKDANEAKSIAEEHLLNDEKKTAVEKVDETNVSVEKTLIDPTEIPVINVATSTPPKAVATDVGLPETPEMNIPDTPKIDVSPSKAVTASPGATTPTSNIARRFMRSMQMQGMQVQVHYFTKVPSSVLAMPIIVDVVDTTTNFSHWLFRPSKLIEVVNFVNNGSSGAKPQTSRFFQQMYGTSLRSPDGEDIAHKKPYTTKSGNQMTITHEIMVSWMSKNLTESQLKVALQAHFSIVSKSHDIRHCYKESVVYENSNPVMKRDLDPSEGRFWKQWDAALENILLIPHDTLEEVFTTQDINRVLDSLFPNLKKDLGIVSYRPSTVNEQIARFAWNHTKTDQTEAQD